MDALKVKYELLQEYIMELKEIKGQLLECMKDYEEYKDEEEVVDSIYAMFVHASVLSNDVEWYRELVEPENENFVQSLEVISDLINRTDDTMSIIDCNWKMKYTLSMAVQSFHNDIYNRYKIIYGEDNISVRACYEDMVKIARIFVMMLEQIIVKLDEWSHETKNMY